MSIDRRLSEGPLSVAPLWSEEQTERLPQRLLAVRRRRALDGVSAKERVAWVLRHVQGESLEDTALLCECSLATAKRRIAEADVHVGQFAGLGEDRS